MKLKKRQRAQVVELLRCAFDQSRSIASIVYENEVDREAAGLAVAARAHVNVENLVEGIAHDYNYYDNCLEAALRVEQGLWP